MKILKAAQAFRELRKKGPAANAPWIIDFSMVELNKMVRYNHHYLGKKSGTDVLSFPAPDPFYSHGILGDLVICRPIAEKQALEAGHPLKDEVAVLLTHGVLHLLGFDHERSLSEKKKMEAWEKKILRKIKSKGKPIRGLTERSRIR